MQLRDPSYKWNEWDLRADALQMSDLRKKKTTSAQTDLRTQRREADSQVRSVLIYYSKPVVPNHCSRDHKCSASSLEVLPGNFEIDNT